MVQGRLLIVETQFGIKNKPYDFYFYFFNKKIENVITLNLCLSFISSFPLSLSHFRFLFFFSLSLIFFPPLLHLSKIFIHHGLKKKEIA
jgi:hypothetical protein